MTDSLKSAFSAFVSPRSPLLQPDLTLRVLYKDDDGKQQGVLDVRAFPPSVPRALTVMFSYLYSGQLLLDGVDPQLMLALARFCALPSLEAKLGEDSLGALLPHALRQQQAAYLEALILALQQQQAQSQHPAPLLLSPSVLSSPSSSSLSPLLPSSPSKRSSPHAATPFDNLGDVLVPSNDKEGWCRNKKYIEKTDSGFMCTVCRKVYGRYNSVSYHVTIYHRNPPIRCDVSGCQFSTREARYIHFHKYYRHHVPLPENIDLGTRKCPFCRHVSKSPAMLEKHVTRHYAEGRVPEARKEEHGVSESESDLSPPQLSPSAFQCELCAYKGSSSSSLAQHWQFKHSSELFLSRPGVHSVDPEACSSSSSSSVSPLFPDSLFH